MFERGIIMSENYKGLVERQRAFFRTGKTKDVEFRVETLNKLVDAMKKYENEILAALRKDLNKSEKEGYRTEIGFVLHEIKYILDNVHTWAKPKEAQTPEVFGNASSMLYPEPYGLALIIAPWNYPFQLAVAPLIGAVCAGNCAVLKPSEFTPATSGVLAKMVQENFPEEYIAVVEGEAETSTALLKEKFDYIFFTGSTGVGKIIMSAAAKHLTPVTLELGGKSPCIVHEDADLDTAAQRITKGKFSNAGQTCVAPDYLLIHKSVKDEFLEKMKVQIKEMFGEDVSKNPDFTHIINDRHFNRLSAFLDNGTRVVGGDTEEDRLFIAPTVLDDIKWEDPVMQDEIFGPILPVIEYDDLTEVIHKIVERPKPLALYLFTEDEEVENTVLGNISFGGGCINDTISHLATPYLPFGGVGESGMGSYHGQGSFDTFTHYKSILKLNRAK